jgi:hypothetical protein
MAKDTKELAHVSIGQFAALIAGRRRRDQVVNHRRQRAGHKFITLVRLARSETLDIHTGFRQPWRVANRDSDSYGSVGDIRVFFRYRSA